MKNQTLTPPYKLLIILGIFALLPACSSSDDDDNDLVNSAPNVSAGEDQTVNQGATVNLTGVASDSDGSISSWLWQQTSGSPSVTIKNSTTSNASFAAPEVDAQTTLVFELEVKDNDGASVSDSMRVTVRGPGDSVNPLPDDFKAEAGDGQVTLTWSHYSSATDYNIYRSSASDCELANYTSCANGALFTSKSSGFVDTGLTNGTTYYYWIEAILDGVTYVDGAAKSATPVVDEDDDDDGFNIDEDDYQTIYTHNDGTIYAVTKETMNWDDARAMAQAQGGDLVTIHSEEENDLVAGLLDGESAWLGASDDGDRIPGAFETHYTDSEDGWRWVDGSELSYENWHSNQPDDAPNNDTSGSEDCLHTNWGSDGAWNDRNCVDQLLYAVFEFSLIDINEDDYQSIYTHSDGTIYAVTKDTMNWDDARAMAQEQGGDLVTIHNAAENDLVADLLESEMGWLGASDDSDRIDGAFETDYTDSEDGWRWIDGSELIYANWSSTQPDDAPNNDTSGSEDCLHTNWGSDGVWNDRNCVDQMLYAIFEFFPISLSDGLIARYEFEGNANDSSGNGHNGEVIGATLTSDRFGEEDGAYHIAADSSFDRISLPAETVNGLEDFTIASWVKFDSANIDYNAILTVSSNISTNLLNIGYYSVNSSWHMRTDAVGDIGDYLFESSSLPTNQWLYVTYMRLGNDAYLYLDGELFGSITIPDTVIAADDGGVIIGQEQDSLGGSFDVNQAMNGDIDSLRIYDRALNTAEIQTLYELGDD